MNNNYSFLNPYNFVRYLSEGADDGSPEVKLLGKCSPPPHDRFIGLNGRMECEIETVTPIFISDSESIVDEGNEHKSFRFFRLKDENGKENFAIPSSSLRGMLRNVFEAVTNSCFSVFEGEKRLSYRLAPKEARKLVPCRIEKDESGNWKLRLFPGTTNYNENGPSKEDCLYAAWIKMYNPLKESKKEQQEPDTPYSKRSILSLPTEIKHGDKCFALLERLEHPAKYVRNRPVGKFFFWNVKAIAKERDKLLELKGNERIEEGYLCITYQNIENKHDERFFFRSFDNKSLPETLDITKDIIQKYQSLINEYKERHRKGIEQIREKATKDYSRVNDGKVAYSRFIIEDKEDLNGELVYAMLEGMPPNLSIKFIVPVTVPRVGYEKTIGALLPKYLHPCTDFNNLCPACRLFGWVHPNPPSDLDAKTAYAGRARLSHAKISENKGVIDDFPLAILSTPKPTATFFYLLKNGRPCFCVKYDIDGAQLRGRKFYRHQNEAKEQEYNRTKQIKDHQKQIKDHQKQIKDHQKQIKDHQNRTLRDALKPGAKFKFIIEFENLAPVELGALIWCVELENGLFHKLGMGKPLGFGSIKISIKNIEIVDIKERYSSYAKYGWNKISDKKKTELINIFKESMHNKYNKDFDKLENINDLKAILSSPALPVHYPRMNNQPTVAGRNFEWFMENKKTGKMPLKLAAEDKGFPLGFNSNRTNRRRRH